MHTTITNTIIAALTRLDLPDVTFTVEYPQQLAHGDYASNVALVCGAQTGNAPRAIAESLVSVLRELAPESIDRIEVAGPGFINFYLSETYLADQVTRIIRDGKQFGASDMLSGEKIIIEYTDPNPLKEFHIGHMMTNTIGEFVARLTEWQGAEVARVCYQGDVGLHIAQAIWGMKENIELLPSHDSPLAEKTAFLGQAYATGARALSEDEQAAQEIRAINRKVYDRSDATINELYDDGKAWSLEQFEALYDVLGTSFDYYIFESEVAPFGKEVSKQLLKQGVFEESDGAVVFRADDEDPSLHTRVFVNSDGLPTYEAKELVLAKTKYDQYPYTKSVVVTNYEIDAYFAVILKAMAHVFPELAEKTQHISHGMLRLQDGKMSSRTGDVITARALLEELEDRVRTRMEESGHADAATTHTVSAIAVSAFKYSVLKQAIGHDVVFEPESSLSFEGDSGPYLQYTYARAQSVLARGTTPADATPSEVPGTLERLLHRFPEVVAQAYVDGYSPQAITTYLISVAQAFNTYYAQYKIVGEAPYRMQITQAVAHVLENGMHILGIAPVAEM